MNKKNILVLIGIGILFFILLFFGLNLTKNIGKTDYQISQEDSSQKLEKLLKKINVTNIESRKGKINLITDISEELPDISKYPLTVKGKTSVTNVEIFSTSEKAGDKYNGWLNEMAQKFNEENNDMSISIRCISSGLGMDYITSGKYQPDAFTPSNELFGEMIKEKGININLIDNKLVGNVAGILLKKEKYDDLIKKYGTINMKTITTAMENNEISMGYTNPFQSATGLNFLVETLSAYDNSNPLSDTAIKGFESFQQNVPFVAETTTQMANAVDNGVLDGLILEYQLYQNSKELKKYTFTPFGVRHDNPLYSIGNLSQEKINILNKFVEYCKKNESIELAKKYGFYGLEDYISENKYYDGRTLLDAQSLWKDKKDNGKPVTAVFVADISGSMDGERLNNLKSSLINASNYINEENYIGLVSYNSNVYINLPINKFDINQRSLFVGAVEDLSASGQTASFDAMCVALDMLQKAKEKNSDTKLLMFLLSDGETNRGYDLNEIKPVVEGFQVPIYTIGYDADIDALKTISNINEADNINADSDDIVYKLKNLFNSQM